MSSEKKSPAVLSEYERKMFRLGKFFNLLLVEKQEFTLYAKKKLKQGGGRLILETISLRKKSKVTFFIKKRESVGIDGVLYDFCIEVSGYEATVVASMHNLDAFLDELPVEKRTALKKGIDKINEQNLVTFMQKQLAVAA